MTQHIKPLNQMDNGGLLAVIRSIVDDVETELQPTVMAAIDLLENRASFDLIKELDY